MTQELWRILKHIWRRFVGNDFISHQELRVSFEIVFWTYDTFDYNTGIKADEHFPLKYFSNYAFSWQTSPNLQGSFCLLQALMG